MTALDLTTTLRSLGLTQAQFASELGVHVQTVNRWATGKIAVPRYVIAYLRERTKP